MTSTMASEALYLALTALLIDREIAKFNRGEQTALVSFTNIAKLARNASEELTGSGMRAYMQRLDACPRAESARTQCEHKRVPSDGQGAEF
jgi:hypothetical protein